MGASVWFFLLVGMEAVRTYKTNPHFTIATYNIPTWITPLALVVVVSALVPKTSLLGHVCGLLVGYFCTSYALTFAKNIGLADEQCANMHHRRTGLYEVSLSSRKGTAIRGVEIEADATFASLCERRSETVRTIWCFAQRHGNPRGAWCGIGRYWFHAKIGALERCTMRMNLGRLFSQVLLCNGLAYIFISGRWLSCYSSPIIVMLALGY